MTLTVSRFSSSSPPKPLIIFEQHTLWTWIEQTTQAISFSSRCRPHSHSTPGVIYWWHNGSVASFADPTQADLLWGNQISRFIIARQCWYCASTASSSASVHPKNARVLQTCLTIYNLLLTTYSQKAQSFFLLSLKFCFLRCALAQDKGSNFAIRSRILQILDLSKHCILTSLMYPLTSDMLSFSFIYSLTALNSWALMCQNSPLHKELALVINSFPMMEANQFPEQFSDPRWVFFLDITGVCSKPKYTIDLSTSCL